MIASINQIFTDSNYSNLTITFQQGSTSVPPNLYSTELQATALTVGIAIVIFGFIGNLLTIIAITKTPSLRHGPNLFILNLSIADLLFCTLTIPVRLTVFIREEWTLGLMMCKINSIISYNLIGTAMLCQVGTAVGRFLLFIWPDTYQRIFKRKQCTLSIVAGCWLAPILVILPLAFGIWGEIGYDPDTKSCRVLCNGDYASYCRFYLTIGLFVPAVIITFCYLRIMRVVCANHKRITIMRFTLRQRQIWHQRPVPNVQDQREDLKYTLMMLCVFSVFLTCYFPYAIYSLVDPQENYIQVNAATLMCAWLSACLNPLVYVLLNSNFRHAIGSMMTCNTANQVVNM